MATDSTPSLNRRRRKRWLIAGGLLCVAVVIVGELLRRDAHRKWQVAEIRAAGGMVRDNRPLLFRFQHWYENRKFSPDANFPGNLTTVCFDEKGSFDHEWFRNHDWFRGLDIQTLAVYTPIPASDLTRLVEVHPLQEFYAHQAELTEEVVAALAAKSSLRSFGPGECELTDEQLSRLPFAQLDFLSVSGTDVTSDGLLILRECRRLATISLNGKQFTAGTADILASLGTVKRINLYGPGVTDNQLERLRQIKTLKHIDLSDTRTTPEGVTALRSAMPDCDDIRVDSTVE